MPPRKPSESYPPGGPPRMPTPPPGAPDLPPSMSVDQSMDHGRPQHNGYRYPSYASGPPEPYDPYAHHYASGPPPPAGGGHFDNPFAGSPSEHEYLAADHHRRMSEIAPYGTQHDMAYPSAQSLPGYGPPPGEDNGEVPLIPAGGHAYQGGYSPVQGHDGFQDGYGGEEQQHDGPIDGPRGRGRASEASYMPGGFNPAMLEEGESAPGIRYGRIPQRVPRRYKTLKRVELYHGNLVLDCPVPGKLLDKLNDRESREFTHMRYTAATCDPDDLKDERYTLRQVLFDPPRRTELFICMTMYNEDEELFTRTMHGVMTNIAHLCTRERSKTWGKEGWKKVVVCIVSDGRMKINSRTLSVLAAMGVYQEGVGKNVVNGKAVTAHIYEYTAQLSVDPQLRFRGREKGIMPVQILFCLKERNQKKINSHRWFFNAFGQVLQPNVCVLLDVGTMPRAKSIYHLWKAFDINSNVAGACGEIVALKGKFWTGLLNPLIGAQNFEYKMSNILDKPLESTFGYISVLPGAFSAYRYIALQNDSTGRGPLHEYFKGETLHGGHSDADIFTSNMYLAEDRILCWELCSKRDAAWVLHYVKSAQAVTDVPDAVPELISQRRRWLNGSFFAGIHSIVKFYYIYRSSHSFGRKLAFHIELLYQTISLIFSWFGLANYFIAFFILTRAVSEVIPQMKIPNTILTYVYLAFVIFCFLMALGNRPAGSKWGYITAMVMFAILTVYMTAAAVGLAVKSIITAQQSGDAASLIGNAVFRNIVVSIAATYGVWLIASILYLEPWHMFTSIIQYMLLSPSFINVINVYAFANTHDVSWGTKGSDKVSTDLGVVGSAGNKNQVDVAIPTEAKDINDAYDDACHVLTTKKPKEIKVIDPETKQKDYYATVRTNVLLVWSLTNAGLAIGILNVSSVSVQIIYMGFLLYSVAALALIKFIGTVVYLIKRLFAGE